MVDDQSGRQARKIRQEASRFDGNLEIREAKRKGKEKGIISKIGIKVDLILVILVAMSISQSIAFLSLFILSIDLRLVCVI